MQILESIIKFLLGMLVGASVAYLTMPTEPRVETCYEYHTFEMSDGVMVDTHLPEFDGCK